MMKQQDLMREVDAIIEERLRDKQPATMTWIVQEIMSRHERIHGEDRDCALLCMREHFHATVREVLRSRRANEEGAEPAQQDFLFPGYQHLQRSYTITRQDEQVVVRLEEMTAEEIRAKARELRAFALGALAHAKELEEYLEYRDGGPGGRARRTA